MMNKAQRLLQLTEAWKDAEKYHREIALKNDPISHGFNKSLQQHFSMANGKDPKVRGRAKAVLRHFVKWQEVSQQFKEKHKKMPTMDDLAAQKPKAIKAWSFYKRSVMPKEKRYQKETWMLNQQAEQSKQKKGS